ncbi:MAG: lysylphosphatidylglycerol synthase transmembrane domain-containing protein, partial [Rudaea sp.]
LALSSATREDLRYDPDLLDELKEALEADIGPLPAQDHESVFRIQRRDVLLVLGLGIGVYALFPQLAQFQQILKAWTTVNPIWIALGLLGSFATYLSSAIAQQGALVKPLSFWRLLLVQFAATFGSRFSPQGVGAAYVIVSFLDKSGIKRETAVTALAVKTTAGVVDHFILVSIVLALLGYSGASFFKGIQLWEIAAAIAAVAAIIIVLRWKFPDRVDRAKQALHSSFRDLVAVLQNPLRAVELLGGSAAITLAYLVTFTICLWATGVNISLIQIAAAFLGGSIVGSASPTPGGLGTVEAALVAALAVFGVNTGQAVAGVLLYRLITFWLPIIPGFFAFRRLQHDNYL